MKLTDVVAIWDALPDFSEEDKPAITFVGFVDAVDAAVGIENDIRVLGGEESGT